MMGNVFSSSISGGSSTGTSYRLFHIRCCLLCGKSVTADFDRQRDCGSSASVHRERVKLEGRRVAMPPVLRVLFVEPSACDMKASVALGSSRQCVHNIAKHEQRTHDISIHQEQVCHHGPVLAGGHSIRSPLRSTSRRLFIQFQVRVMFRVSGLGFSKPRAQTDLL